MARMPEVMMEEIGSPPDDLWPYEDYDTHVGYILESSEGEEEEETKLEIEELSEALQLDEDQFDESFARFEELGDEGN